MLDSLTYFACYMNTKKIPMEYKCVKGFSSEIEAQKYLDSTLGEPIERNKSYYTTTVPICKYLPDFFASYRAHKNSKNVFVIEEKKSI